jgi:Na+-translocating ferredoxin:NAD+ oxidoreductase RnfD subunit
VLTALGSGGLMLGAWFLATDPGSSPMTRNGAWIYGLAIGVLVVVIRQFSGQPEGVMYAFCWAARWCRTSIAGRGRGRWVWRAAP